VDVPLDRWLAQRLAADLGLPTAELPDGFALNEVVSLHLRRRGEREELYPRIRLARRTDNFQVSGVPTIKAAISGEKAWGQERAPSRGTADRNRRERKGGPGGRTHPVTDPGPRSRPG